MDAAATRRGIPRDQREDLHSAAQLVAFRCVREWKQRGKFENYLAATLARELRGGKPITDALAHATETVTGHTATTPALSEIFTHTNLSEIVRQLSPRLAAIARIVTECDGDLAWAARRMGRRASGIPALRRELNRIIRIIKAKDGQSKT